MRWILGVAALVMAGCAAPQGGVDEAPADLIADGKVIALTQCASCHAPGSQGRSNRPDAPPLRVILSGYASDALAEDLINGIKMGHPDMPQFDFSPRETQSLVAYLKSIQETENAARPHRVN